MTLPGYSRNYTQATVGVTDHIITLPFEADQITLSASGDIRYSVISTVPAASGSFFSASESPVFMKVVTDTIRVASTTVAPVEVAVLAEKWDPNRVMTLSHPQIDAFGLKNKTGGATRVGTASTGDT